MRSTRRKRLGLLTIAGLLAGFGLVFAASGAGAAPATASGGATTQALQYSVNGTWTDDGRAKPKITVVSNTVLIDMSYAHRPNATGTVIDASSILVTFPDLPNTYIGTFYGPGYLAWSNGSAWQKPYTGATTIGLNENWTDGWAPPGRISETAGFLSVDLTQARRPRAYGYVVDSSTIRVTFPDAATITGTLVAAPDGGLIQWSNTTQWHVWVDPGGPGNPECLILC
jgi:hypothetical protein